MTFLYPLSILILLICFTGGIVSFYYEPRKPIVGYKEHEPAYMIAYDDMFLSDVKYCRSCGETDLSGNCYPKLFFTNCDIRVGLDRNTHKSALQCHTHYKATTNAYQCRCEFPAGVKATEYVAPQLMP